MAAPASRLLSTGALLANSMLDENTSIAPSKFSTTATTIYAAEFDEVTINGGSVARREIDTGVMQVSNEFDEVTLASGSMAFDGTNQFVSVPSSTAVAFDTADFTIECWWYATTTTGINVFDSRTSSTGNGININCTGVTLAPQYRPAGVTQITGSALSLNTWYHLAVVRSSAETRIYVNGVQSGPTYADTINFTSNPARTGANFNSGGLSTGYITNLRVTKAAVYTSTFTPPQQILPALSSTTWLLNVLNSDNLITDNSTNKFTATNNGTVAWSATGPFNA